MLEDIFDIKLIEQVAESIFSRSSRMIVERVEEGVSSYVYRIYHAGEIFYLRVLPELDASFAPEVYVHQLLRKRHIKVPAVVYFEHYNEVLQRSVMVTTEIKGTHLDHNLSEQDVRAILFAAGRDLAVINSLPVIHFGWVKRDKQEVTYLEAELPSYRAFIYEHLESDLAILLEAQALKKSENIAIHQIVNQFAGWLDDERAYLAHGDFDVTHIYQYQGRYSGIIDFGEIRGANALYDLGHFRMHDGETLPSLVLPYLLDGYKEVHPLSLEDELKIYFSSLLIAIRTLARSVQKKRDIGNHQGLKSIERDLQALGLMK